MSSVAAIKRLQVACSNCCAARLSLRRQRCPCGLLLRALGSCVHCSSRAGSSGRALALLGFRERSHMTGTLGCPTLWCTKHQMEKAQSSIGVACHMSGWCVCLARNCMVVRAHRKLCSPEIAAAVTFGICIAPTNHRSRPSHCSSWSVLHMVWHADYIRLACVTHVTCAWR